jgi:NitT/TauT family transport system permease protein
MAFRKDIISFRSKYEIIFFQCTLLLVLTSVWEILGRFGFIDIRYVGLPSNIITKGTNLVFKEVFIESLAETMVAFFGGLISGIIIGVIWGSIIGSSKRLNSILSPYIFVLNAVPPIVFFPIIIIGLGSNMMATILIVILMVLPVILVNTADGVARVDKELIKMARSFGADKYQSYRYITFFGSLPEIMTGIRLSVGRALTGVIIAEFFGIGTGLGYLISRYGSTYKADEMMAVVIIVAIISICLIKYFEWLEKNIYKQYG